jgi:hypothetical protein
MPAAERLPLLSLVWLCAVPPAYAEEAASALQSRSVQMTWVVKKAVWAPSFSNAFAMK